MEIVYIDGLKYPKSCNVCIFRRGLHCYFDTSPEIYKIVLTRNEIPDWCKLRKKVIADEFSK